MMKRMFMFFMLLALAPLGAFAGSKDEVSSSTSWEQLQEDRSIYIASPRILMSVSDSYYRTSFVSYTRVCYLAGSDQLRSMYKVGAYRELNPRQGAESSPYKKVYAYHDRVYEKRVCTDEHPKTGDCRRGKMETIEVEIPLERNLKVYRNKPYPNPKEGYPWHERNFLFTKKWTVPNCPN